MTSQTSLVLTKAVYTPDVLKGERGEKYNRELVTKERIKQTKRVEEWIREDRRNKRVGATDEERRDQEIRRSRCWNDSLMVWFGLSFYGHFMHTLG
ncbi:hypothetical protein CDAR_546751 [Caerostris darwini]|uniref:Uncharacterized protein n=1 Tax=Caerostris darwini TaxID=1538125 RepID=A0AAV4WVV8_9ARAC|nr:hypothetical protein CDAR_546751 [Caerostris darwini]